MLTRSCQHPYSLLPNFIAQPPFFCPLITTTSACGFHSSLRNQTPRSLAGCALLSGILSVLSVGSNPGRPPPRRSPPSPWEHSSSHHPQPTASTHHLSTLEDLQGPAASSQCRGLGSPVAAPGPRPPAAHGSPSPRAPAPQAPPLPPRPLPRLAKPRPHSPEASPRARRLLGVGERECC